MMNRMKNTGLVLCGLALGLSLSAPAAQAVESLKATLSNHRVLVDGQEVQMEAYVIGGSNYVKLRDIGKQVGFNVYWDGTNSCVQVESGRPYTGEAPAKADPVTPEQTEHVSIDAAAAKQDIIDRTNALRRENGVSALTVNDMLMQAAQVRAEEMAASGVYSHTRPDGRKYTTVTDCPYIGENICQMPLIYLAQQKTTLPERVVLLWSNSSGHRKNMTNARYGEIGIGLAKGTDENGLECWYCVQTFLLNGYDITWVDTPAAKK